MSRRLILANYGSGGDIEIDTTHVIYYTSSDGKIVAPYKTNVFGANIISNTYADGSGVITFDGDVTSIGNQAFNACSSLTSVTIPNSVTTIGDFAFSLCRNLRSVTIPDSVTTIGENAFWYCERLTSITIPNGVTSIGSSAFKSCSRLTSVTIGDSITTIGDYAFNACTRLTSVYCKATTPPSLDGTYVFDSNGSGRKIYVPAGSVDAYKSATRWNEYADAIVGYNFEESGEENEGNLITFTIDGVEYQAEQGMTWAVGCESSYNTDGFIYAGGDANLVIYVSGYKRYVNIGTSADPSTVKITNTSYTTKTVNGPR